MPSFHPWGEQHRYEERGQRGGSKHGAGGVRKPYGSLRLIYVRVDGDRRRSRPGRVTSSLLGHGILISMLANPLTTMGGGSARSTGYAGGSRS